MENNKNIIKNCDKCDKEGLLSLLGASIIIPTSLIMFVTLFFIGFAETNTILDIKVNNNHWHNLQISGLFFLSIALVCILCYLGAAIYYAFKNFKFWKGVHVLLKYYYQSKTSIFVLKTSALFKK